MLWALFIPKLTQSTPTQAKQLAKVLIVPASNKTFTLKNAATRLD